MKITLAVVCGLILLAGVPLIWRVWPPLPAPEWEPGRLFACVYTQKDGYVEIVPPKWTNTCHQTKEGEQLIFGDGSKGGRILFKNGIYPIYTNEF